LVETICRVDYSTTSNHKIKSHQLGSLFLAVDSVVAEDVLNQKNFLHLQRGL
jgi:hypothetical protein